MKSRMDKYYEEESSNITTRSNKNRELYSNINSFEVDGDYNLETNQMVLDDNANNIDVEQIKKILDNKYNREPKRRSIVIEETEKLPKISLDETREYDINAILEHAKQEQEDDYEKERLKKIKDTNYDILSNLKPDEIDEEKNEKDELEELINTITLKESEIKNATKEMDPLDILTDLKGSENTVVIGGVKTDEDDSETNPIMNLEEAEKRKIELTQDLSSALQFTQSDFDDFNDLKKEVKSSRALIYVVITLISILIIIGLIIIAKKILNF